MNHIQMRDVSETLLISMTEAEFARIRQGQGAKIVCHQGRYWEEIRSGFYQPIHWLARLHLEEITRPSPLCWGFRATLFSESINTANGAIPVHLLSNLKNYDLPNLSSNRRNHLRRCRKRAKIVELLNPVLLQEQGYEVLLSALQRAAYAQPPSKDQYLANLAKNFIPHQVILAGLVDERLGGYIEGFAVDGTAYIQSVYIATEALSTYIGTGLVFDFVQICRRSNNVRQIVYGQHSREDSALCTFKEGMDFSVKLVPAKVEINPVMGKFIRWCRPHVYYRLTGQN